MVTLTANNGAGPVVAMDMIQVDDPITTLSLHYEPVDPAVGEGMIFIVTSDDKSSFIDVSTFPALVFGMIFTSLGRYFWDPFRKFISLLQCLL